MATELKEYQVGTPEKQTYVVRARSKPHLLAILKHPGTSCTLDGKKVQRPKIFNPIQIKVKDGNSFINTP